MSENKHAELPAGLTTARLIALHKKLLVLRHTEETIARRYSEQEMRTPTHLGTGQEAAAVGVCGALTPDDAAYTHHRSHNHYLAMGGSVYALAAELYGRMDGCSRGRGGSVHLTDRKHGFIASTAILGETIACAVGSALAFRMDKKPSVAATFFGDGSCEEGIVYECLNYAAIQKLPVIFVCENNLYATESPLSTRQAAGTALTERARSFRIPAETVDGNDLLAVYEAATRAIARARAGEGATFLELMTYRWREHVGPKFDHELNRTYRSKSELDEWMQKDPVVRSASALVAMGAASMTETEEWALEVQAQIDADFDRARRAPWPETKALFEGVY
jgi:TPP-dependent pyruvate/acetoin dehydrogenase alpha subunit